MAPHSRRVTEFRSQVEREQEYSLEEAYALLSKYAKAKFIESVEVAINTGVDPRKSDQMMRGATTLPHGNGKQVRVAVFAEGDYASQANEAGADMVGFKDLIQQVKGGEINFDVAIAPPEAMRELAQLGQVLGPRGLMPSPKSGTVTKDIAEAVAKAKKGQVMYRIEKGGIIHGIIGKIDFTVDAIKENLEVLLQDLMKAKPPSVKGTFVKKIVLSTTMGPGVCVDKSSLHI